MPDKFDAVVRVGAFIVVLFIALVVSGSLMFGMDPVARSAGANFVAGLVANLVLVFKFERGVPADFGLRWGPSAGTQWMKGVLAGVAAIGLGIGGAVLLGLAEFERAPFDWSPVAVVAVLLVGAAGEELMFRGYAFQYLAREYSPVWTVINVGAVFGLAHWLTNQNIDPIGAVNTALWGSLFGYAYVRTGTLWLPIGLHFGWNTALALSTSNLSGLTIRASGWDLRWSAGDLWSGGPYGLEGGLITTFLAVVVFAFVRRVR